jgi:hypothetical protein
MRSPRVTVASDTRGLGLTITPLPVPCMLDFADSQQSEWASEIAAAISDASEWDRLSPGRESRGGAWSIRSWLLS